MLCMLQVVRAVGGKVGWTARCQKMMSKFSRAAGLNDATDQLGVLLPMVMLALLRRILLRPD
jgi:hypothetical protein